jgi:hypothetical protein
MFRVVLSPHKSVNQTRPHCVNQLGKLHSKHLAARHGRGTAWARHAMCESTFTRLPTSFTQFRYLPLTVFPFKAPCKQPLLIITNGFLNVSRQLKFKTDCTVQPATDVSIPSLYCTNNVRLQYSTKIKYIILDLKLSPCFECYMLSSGYFPGF